MRCKTRTIHAILHVSASASWFVLAVVLHQLIRAKVGSVDTFLDHMRDPSIPSSMVDFRQDQKDILLSQSTICRAVKQFQDKISCDSFEPMHTVRITSSYQTYWAINDIQQGRSSSRDNSRDTRRLREGALKTKVDEKMRRKITQHSSSQFSNHYTESQPKITIISFLLQNPR